jgi:tight adherence protein B
MVELLTLNPILLLAIGAMGVAIVIAMFFLGGSLVGPRARFERRLATVAGDAGGVLGRDPRGGARSGGMRRRDIEAKLKQAEAIREKKEGYKLREQLVQAGLDMTPERFYLYSAISAAVVTLLAVFGLAPSPFTLAGGLMAVMGLIVGGFGIPRFVLGYLVKRRVEKFISTFAEAIDMIVRGVRTGMTVGESLLIVSREIGDPLGSEFRGVTDGIQMGMTMEDALNRLVSHVPSTEVRFFAIVLATQQTTGGNLAETLSKLSEILRSRKKMRDKVQALSSEAKASAMIIGSLPFAVATLLAFVATDYISLLFTTDAGNWLLVIAAGTMSVGIFVMRQMINFDI